MNTMRSVLLAGGLFVAGLGIGFAANQPLSSAYHDKAKAEAAHALLDVAMEQADGGSWEEIAIGRLYYLSGDKQRGDEIFNRWLTDDAEASDVWRIARAYAEAGNWNKARPLFERYLVRNDDDYRAFADVGAFYLLQGDREHAEKLFDQAFEMETEFWSTMSAAGAYLGIAPE